MTVNRPIRVSPSLMCADFLHLGRQLEVMAQQKVDCLHVDVMDGHYVPNFAFGPDFCRALCTGRAGSSTIPALAPEARISSTVRSGWREVSG